MDLSARYTKEFYDRIKEPGRKFAHAVIPEIRTARRADSVIDFGCGNGSFLKGCAEQGASIIGIDGMHVEESLLIDPDLVVFEDLRAPVHLPLHVDLVVSLETAEHLEPEHEGVFIDTLCEHGDLILFSAAQPGQPGVHHVNCRPLEYWAGMFAFRGFMLDLPLTRFIREGDHPNWYRRNGMVFFLQEGRS